MEILIGYLCAMAITYTITYVLFTQSSLLADKLNEKVTFLRTAALVLLFLINVAVLALALIVSAKALIAVIDFI